MADRSRPAQADGRRPRPDGAHRPHPVRFPPEHPLYDEVMEAHADAVAAGQAGYLDPATGLFAMTGAHLLARGWCCDRGCRHCPWVGGPREAEATDASPAQDAVTDDEETT